MWASLANKSKIRRNIKGVAMTINREKLNNMTNEELAEFFETYSNCEECPFKYAECSGGEVRCKKIMLEWLESEE